MNKVLKWIFKFSWNRVAILFMLLIPSFLFLGIPLMIYFSIPTNPLVENIIIIEADSDFDKYNLNGTGSRQNPFMIEDLLLGVNSSGIGNRYYGLDVANTTKYFVVRNCTFFGGDDAIRIRNIAPGTCKILNNSIYHISQAIVDYFHGRSGIVIENSNGIIISGNTLATAFEKDPEEGSSGIIVKNSNNTVIEDNIQIHRINAGYYSSVFEVISSYNVNISRNFIWSFDHGILYVFCSNSIISNNTILSHGSSIRLHTSYNISIVHNSFHLAEESIDPISQIECYNITDFGNEIHYDLHEYYNYDD